MRPESAKTLINPGENVIFWAEKWTKREPDAEPGKVLKELKNPLVSGQKLEKPFQGYHFL